MTGRGGRGSVGDRIAARGGGRFNVRGTMIPRGSGAGRRNLGSPPPLQQLPPDAIQRRKAANPRDAPGGGGNVEYP